MRHAKVAGKFYPENKDELKRQTDKFFSSLDVASQKPRNLRAAIVPHSIYAYSGKCASFVYSLIKNTSFDSFIILGTNHSSLGSRFSLSIEDFETPFGNVENDIEIIEQMVTLAREEDIDLEVDENSHKYEHSIEVQLPFLQSVQKNFKIVPVLVSNPSIEEINKFASILSRLIEKSGKKIFVLASSDFTHYGLNYGFLPFLDDIRENLYAFDEKIILSILKLDVNNFIEKTKDSSVCGRSAIACLVQFAKLLNLKVEKLCYYTSGDVIDEWDSVVGYASIGFS
jgi:hypothetical protein